MVDGNPASQLWENNELDGFLHDCAVVVRSARRRCSRSYARTLDKSVCTSNDPVQALAESVSHRQKHIKRRSHSSPFDLR
jgi:hypothetical protein